MLLGRLLAARRREVFIVSLTKLAFCMQVDSSCQREVYFYNEQILLKRMLAALRREVFFASLTMFAFCMHKCNLLELSLPCRQRSLCCTRPVALCQETSMASQPNL